MRNVLILASLVAASATAQTPPVEVGAMCDKHGNILIAVAAHQAGLYKFTLPVNFCGVGV
jgi:hypothetical protein